MEHEQSCEEKPGDLPHHRNQHAFEGEAGVTDNLLGWPCGAKLPFGLAPAPMNFSAPMPPRIIDPC